MKKFRNISRINPKKLKGELLISYDWAKKVCKKLTILMRSVVWRKDTCHYKRALFVTQSAD